MKLTAEEFIDEVNGHNSWQHYPPSKQKVIGWLKQFAEMQVEAINYSRCCKSDSELLCDHPRSERSYIGQNMLKCNKCGKEFS